MYISNKYTDLKISRTRTLKNNGCCRAVGCRLDGNVIPKGTKAVEFSLKCRFYYLCPECALNFAADLKEAAESVLTAHEVTRAALARKQA